MKQDSKIFIGTQKYSTFKNTKFTPSGIQSKFFGLAKKKENISLVSQWKPTKNWVDFTISRQGQYYKMLNYICYVQMSRDDLKEVF